MSTRGGTTTAMIPARCSACSCSGRPLASSALGLLRRRSCSRPRSGHGLRLRLPCLLDSDVLGCSIVEVEDDGLILHCALPIGTRAELGNPGAAAGLAPERRPRPVPVCHSTYKLVRLLSNEGIVTEKVCPPWCPDFGRTETDAIRLYQTVWRAAKRGSMTAHWHSHTANAPVVFGVQTAHHS